MVHSIILKILLASSLVLGAHEMGHQVQADDIGVRRSLRSLIPISYTLHTEDKKQLARISNGGFMGQDLLSNRAESKYIYTASAINKIGYVIRNAEDINTMSNANNRALFREALIASALMDILKTAGKMPNTSLSFTQASDGTPMLELNHRW